MRAPVTRTVYYKDESIEIVHEVLNSPGDRGQVISILGIEVSGIGDYWIDWVKAADLPHPDTTVVCDRDREFQASEAFSLIVAEAILAGPDTAARRKRIEPLIEAARGP